MLTSNRLVILIFLFLSLILLQSSVLSQEVNQDFQNVAIEPQTGVFLATFTATATVDLVDGVLGFSKDEPDGYGDYSCKILFNNAGFITANNGGTFEADSALAYTGGTAHAIKVLVNILDQTFSVWVTPDGGEEVTIGENFAFSPTAGVVDSINWRSVKMDFSAPYGGAEGVVQVTDFSIELPNEINVNSAYEPQDGRFMVEFNAHPTVDLVDGVIGFSKSKPKGWSEPVKLLFNNSGKFTASNAGSYQALNDFSYSGGMTYAIRMIIDIPMQTFDVWIAPEGGDEVAIGKDYGFSSAADTLQWRTVIMSFGAPYGGAVGFVEITDFTISEAPVEKKTCLFVQHDNVDTAARDTILVDHLKEKYDVTLIKHNEALWDSLTIEQLKEYDFLFISESAGTFHLRTADDSLGLRTIPIPTFLTEGYATQAGVLGWTTQADGFGVIEDSLLLNGADKVIITDDYPDHYLAAGFNPWDEVQILSQEGAGHVTVTYTVPEIDHIKIALSYADPLKTVVMGVEAGTTVWNKDGTELTEVTQNRAALVGIHAAANAYITEDGFKLIDAGIEWVLGAEATAIGDEIASAPTEFNLAQNYPNPFNPSTEIEFTLSQTGRTTLTIYNVLGQKVATLLDKKMSQGKHQVTFNAVNLSSGIYFYQLRTDKSSQIRKMMLLK